jgi:hypothetical protein
MIKKVQEVSDPKCAISSSQSYTPETCFQVHMSLATELHINIQLTNNLIHAICWASGDHEMWLALFGNVTQIGNNVL